MTQTADAHPRERRPLRVLVAEDAQGDLLFMREAFRARAPQVSLHPLGDGAALLRRLSAEESMPPGAQARLLILDANLPRLDLRALAIALRALSPSPQMLILASHDAQAERLASLGSLEARVVMRPLYYGQWLALVESLMPSLEGRLSSSDIRPPAPQPRARS